MERRTFVKGAAAASAASFAFGPGLFDGARASAQSEHAGGPGRSTQPNILVIKVDQLRFPKVFPHGIDSADEFLKKYMPNLYLLWQNGVKFTSHYTAACACTPARGTIITGLYSQQSWLVSTLLAAPYASISPQPWLNPAYPTYGKLLKAVGYRTPYVGKWHVSIPPASAARLEAYGFQGQTYYDPTGANLQGTYGDETNGYHNDSYIATQGAGWLTKYGSSGAPWCLTVSLINPHDKEFYWAGTEFQTYNDLFPPGGSSAPFTYYSYNQVGNKPPLVTWNENQLKSPDPLGYPAVPPNWESAEHIAENKPSTQTFSRLFQEAVWGGVADDPRQQNFAVAPFPPAPYAPIPSKFGPPLGIGVAPYSYWQRGLDSYTQIMRVVDGSIGEVLSGFTRLPVSVQNNTVIVFMSDHGEFAGAHGFVSGKVGALYDEAYHVPLIVVDPSGRFTADIGTPRQGLTSSVDILPLLVSLGYGGSRSWMQGYLGQIYAERHDLLPMLRSPRAAGRDYVLMATDESALGYLNFNHSPAHLVGVRTQALKFGLYANWQGVSAQIADDSTLETELYDYATARGRAELDNRKHDPRIPFLKETLLEYLVPHVLRAPLPGALGTAQELSKVAYLAYAAFIRNFNPTGSSGVGQLLANLPFGQDF